MFDFHDRDTDPGYRLSTTRSAWGLALLFAAAGAAATPLSSEEIAKLGFSGTELTPIGTVSRLKPELEQLPEPELPVFYLKA